MPAHRVKYLLALLMLTAPACTKTDQVVILATARTQGRLWTGRAPGIKDGPGSGGFAVFKRLFEGERAPKLAVDAGHWAAAANEGDLTQGRSTIACMNAVPYSLTAAGLQDLALAPKDLQRLAETAQFPVLGSNLYLKTSRKPGFLSSHKVLEAGRHKIGFFSIILPDPANPNRTKQLANYKLEKETYETERAIRALRTDGAKIIVMLLSVSPQTRVQKEFYRDFLAQVPRIDLIITDDSSMKKPFKVNHSWVVRTGFKMEEVARIALKIDPATGKLCSLDWKILSLDEAKYGVDAAVAKIAETYRASSEAHFSKRVGFLNSPLPLRANGLSPVTEFAADCIKTWARANAAIIGSSEPAAGFSSGPVTIADLYKAFPADSSVVFVKIRGDDLENVLAGMPPGEFSVSGLRLFLKNGALERVEAANGPLAPARVYHLAVPDSLVSGQNNAVLSNAMEFANSRRAVREIVSWCLSSRKSFNQPENGRVIRN